MKLKLDLDLNVNELVDGLKAEVRAVTAKVMAAAKDKAHELASQRLGPSGLQHWEKGFAAHKVNDDLYIISMEGKLASWMEDGIKTGEISQAIMSGNRATHNSAEGKKYVDVPFMKDADQAGNIRGTGLNVRAFADADSLMKNVKFSDYKNKSVTEQKRVVSRVRDIIKSTSPEPAKDVQYLTIRRVTENSTWPETPFEGAGVFEDLELFIDTKFQELLENM